MITGTMEKKFSHSRDPHGVWWLKINGNFEPDAFPIISAIESKVLLKTVIAVQEQELVIDLATLKDFDSRGLQALLMLHKQFSPKNIQVKLRNPNHSLSQILRITQFDRFIPVEYDENRPRER